MPINFSAGKISSHYAAWQTLTSDAHILDIVKNGYKLELESLPFVCSQNQIKFHATDNTIISKLIQDLKTKGVVEEVISKDKGEIISKVFVRPKSDGNYRLTLNLKKLNEHMEKIHFKMETLKVSIDPCEKRGLICKNRFKRYILQCHDIGIKQKIPAV